MQRTILAAMLAATLGGCGMIDNAARVVDEYNSKADAAASFVGDVCNQPPDLRKAPADKFSERVRKHDAVAEFDLDEAVVCEDEIGQN